MLMIVTCTLIHTNKNNCVIMMMLKVGHAHHEKTLSQRVCRQAAVATVVLVQFANTTLFGGRHYYWMVTDDGTVHHVVVVVVVVVVVAFWIRTGRYC
jgi:hypothetical protein